MTKRLDVLDEPFTQEILNEIVLWKVNRYASFGSRKIEQQNEISLTQTELDVEATKDILNQLLAIAGVKLPVASTILRFKNSNIYQIVDRRAYRVFYGHSYPSSSVLAKNIDLYLKYLADLRIAADKYDIPFKFMDRYLYQLDKKLNKDFPINTTVKRRGKK